MAENLELVHVPASETVIFVVSVVKDHDEMAAMEFTNPEKNNHNHNHYHNILRNIDVLGRECLWSLVLLSARGR